MTKAVHKQTIKVVEAGTFRQKQDNDNTISTKATASTSRKSTPKKGTAFTEVEEDDNEEEEEGLPLPIYEESLRENGVISLNDGESSCMFVGDCVSEFGIGCVQVADAPKPTTSKGVIFTDAGE